MAEDLASKVDQILSKLSQLENIDSVDRINQPIKGRSKKYSRGNKYTSDKRKIPE